MSNEHVQPGDLDWNCAKCGCDLEVGPVSVEYMGARFSANLAKCPRCGMVMISEETAMGKMAAAEQILEDK